jgi:3-deoxy-D-manno-octulosonic-acid transferase
LILQQLVFYTYNILLLLVALLYLPFFLILLLADKDARQRRLMRLGFGCGVDKEVDLLLHGVSVGEVKAIRSLVEQIKKDYPGLKLAISTTTVTGYQTAKAIYPELPVVVYPLDMFGACSRFLNAVSPKLVVLAELELWPNFLRACQKRKIDVAVVNGRITSRSLAGYRRIGRWLPRFGNVCFFGVQTELYAERFQQLGVAESDIVITGNIKYDSLHFPESDNFTTAWSRWAEANNLLLAASTHAPEESQLLTEYVKHDFESTVFVIAPRHPHRCQELLTKLQRAHVDLRIDLFSQTKNNEQLECDVLIVDVLGQLESAFTNSQSCFIGGSLLDHGGQNLLEAAVANCALVMGPSHYNFKDEVSLLSAVDGMLIGKNAENVLELLLELQQNSEKRRILAQNARNALESQRGTAKITLDVMRDLGLLPLK